MYRIIYDQQQGLVLQGYKKVQLYFQMFAPTIVVVCQCFFNDPILYLHPYETQMLPHSICSGNNAVNYFTNKN